MRIITTSGSRSIDVVLRDLAASNDYDVIITNESTKASTTLNVTSTESAIDANMRQLNIPITDTYNEGDELSFYIIETGTTEVLHRNKIFVTDQVPQDYSI